MFPSYDTPRFKRQSSVRYFYLLPFAFCLLLFLSACARGAPTSGGPLVTITSPEEGATIPTGQVVEIQSVASDNTTPVQRVEMYINGDLIADDSTPNAEGQDSLSVTQRWVPVEPGEAQVEVYAYNVENERSQPATLTLNVEGPGLAQAQPTADTTPPVQEEPTAEPTATPEPTPEPPTGIQGKVNADIGLNVRSGPGTQNDRIGGVNVNETVTAIARNQGGDWVKIRYRDGDEGWVAAQYVTWQGDVQTLPVE